MSGPVYPYRDQSMDPLFAKLATHGLPITRELLKGPVRIDVIGGTCAISVAGCHYWVGHGLAEIFYART